MLSVGIVGTLDFKADEEVPGNLSGDRLSIDVGLCLVPHGARVRYVSNRSECPPVTITGGYPLAIEPDRDADRHFDLVLVTPYELDAWNRRCGRYMTRRTRVALVLPAVWWYEHPDLFPLSLLKKVVRFIRDHADFVIVSNDRAKDYMERFLQCMCRVEDMPVVSHFYSAGDRAPARQRGPHEGPITLMDAGGAWRWTDLDTFLLAFGRHLESAPDSRLRLVLPGFKPEDNFDHAEYVKRCRQIAEGISARRPDNIRILDWHDRKGYADELMRMDVGLHVNKPGLEEWLSSRVRVQEYVQRGVPLLSTKGNYFFSNYPSACIGVEPSIESYLEALEALENGAVNVSSLDYETAIADLRSERMGRRLLREIEAAWARSKRFMGGDSLADAVLPSESNVTDFFRLSMLQVEAVPAYIVPGMLKRILEDRNSIRSLFGVDAAAGEGVLTGLADAAWVHGPEVVKDVLGRMKADDFDRVVYLAALILAEGASRGGLQPMIADGYLSE